MNLPPHPSHPRAPRLRKGRSARVAVALVVAIGSTGGLYAQYSRLAPTERAPLPLNRDDGILLGPLVFSPSVTLNLAYDTNIFKVEDGYEYPFTITIPTTPTPTTLFLRTPPQHPRGDFPGTGGARLALKLPFSHSYTTLVWSPQRSDYADIAAPLKDSQQLLWDTRISFSNGSTLRFQRESGRGFFETKFWLFDPLVPDGSGFRMSAIPFSRSRTQMDYDWSFGGRWGVSGNLLRSVYKYGRTEVVIPSSNSSGQGSAQATDYEGFDSATDSIETRAYRNFSRFQVYARISIGRTDQDLRNFNRSRLARAIARGDCPLFPTPNEPVRCASLRTAIDFEQVDQLTAGVGIKGNILRKTEGDLKVGYSNLKFRKGGSEPFQGISFVGTINHTFDAKTFLHAQFQRVPSQASAEYGGYYLRQEVTAWVERKLTMQLSASLGLGANYKSWPAASSNAADEVARLAVSPITDYYGFVDLRYRPGRAGQQGPLLMVLSYGPRQTVTNRLGESTSGQRLSLSLQCGWF